MYAYFASILKLSGGFATFSEQLEAADPQKVKKRQRISETNSVSEFAFSPRNFSLFCVVNLNKIIIKWLNIDTFLSIFGQKCIQNCPKLIKLI